AAVGLVVRRHATPLCVPGGRAGSTTVTTWWGGGGRPGTRRPPGGEARRTVLPGRVLLLGGRNMKKMVGSDLRHPPSRVLLPGNRGDKQWQSSLSTCS